VAGVIQRYLSSGGVAFLAPGSVAERRQRGFAQFARWMITDAGWRWTFRTCSGEEWLPRADCWPGRRRCTLSKDAGMDRRRLDAAKGKTVSYAPEGLHLISLRHLGGQDEPCPADLVRRRGSETI